MTPAQFLGRIKRNEVPPVVLFLGQEGYNRKRCRAALTAASTVAVETFDAAQTAIAAIIDDARSMSLFASERLMFVTSAEAAMPRTSRTAAVSSVLSLTIGSARDAGEGRARFAMSISESRISRATFPIGRRRLRRPDGRP